MVIQTLHVVPPILDQYDDQGALFLRELGPLPVPEFIKTAADTSLAQPYATDFALVANTPQGRVYKFPLHDKGNTFVSAVYFEKTASALPQQVRAVAAHAIAAALIDYKLDVPDYLVDAQLLDKEAAPRLSLEAEYEQRFPEHAEEELIREFRGLHPLARHEAAVLLKQGGVVLPAELEHYTGLAVNATSFERAVTARARLVLPEEAVHLKELNKVASATDTHLLAETLYEIDKELGLTQYYDTTLPDPYTSVLGVAQLRKVASTQAVINGRTYDADDLKARIAGAAAQITDVFGSETADALLLDPVGVLGSLPVPHQQALTGILDDVDSN